MNPKAARLTRLIKLFTVMVPVAHLGGVPGGDLMLPSMQGSSEGSGLDRIVLVLEVTAELGHPLESQVGIAMGVELADRLFRLWTRLRPPSNF